MIGFLPLIGQLIGGIANRNNSSSDSPLEAVKEHDRKKSKEDAAFQMYKRDKDSESIKLNGLMDLWTYGLMDLWTYGLMDSSIKQVNAITENGKKINI